MKNLIVIVLSALITNVLPGSVIAQTLSSDNYKVLTSDFRPGGLSTSENYDASSILGAFEGLILNSDNYKTHGGYGGTLADVDILSATISNTTVSLGELSTNSVAQNSITITATSNSTTGYTIRMSENQNLSDGSNDINDVTDGTVSAGSEEYGIRTAGTAGQFNNTDTAITSSLKTITNHGSAVTDQVTTVTFKASIASDTTAGSYNHTVTFATVSNF